MARLATASERDGQLKRLADQMASLDIAMVTTVGEAGRLVSRPLSTQHAALAAGVVRIFTERDSAKVAELAADPRINLAYASKDKNVFLSVAGEAGTNDDPSVKDALWNDALKAFFPKGKDDPNLTVLEVRIASIEAWEGPRSWLGKAVGFLIARVTGDESALGGQVRVDLTGRPKAAKASRPAKKAPTRKAAAKAAPARRTAAGGSRSRRTGGRG